MFELNNQFLWYLALIRVVMQILPINWNQLPVTMKMAGGGEKIHRMGLFFAIGVLVFLTPTLWL